MNKFLNIECECFGSIFFFKFYYGIVILLNFNVGSVGYIIVIFGNRRIFFLWGNIDCIFFCFCEGIGINIVVNGFISDVVIFEFYSWIEVFLNLYIF